MEEAVGEVREEDEEEEEARERDLVDLRRLER